MIRSRPNYVDTIPTSRERIRLWPRSGSKEEA